MAHRRLLVDRVLLCAWRMPEQEDITAILRDLTEHRARLGRPLLYLSVIGKNGIPQGAVREQVVGFYQAILQACDSMHVVIEGSEFEQSVKRSVIAGVLLVVDAARGRVYVESTFESVLQVSPPEIKDELSAALRHESAHTLLEFARA